MAKVLDNDPACVDAVAFVRRNGANARHKGIMVSAGSSAVSQAVAKDKRLHTDIANAFQRATAGLTATPTGPRDASTPKRTFSGHGAGLAKCTR